MYTSGTTGTPKGAVLTHGNMIANFTCVHFHKSIIKVRKEHPNYKSSSLVFLPLAHIAGRSAYM